MKTSLVTTGNIRPFMLTGRYPVHKSLVKGSNNMFKLDEYLHVKLSNGLVMSLPQGYTWTKIRVPFIMRILCPSDCFTELPYLIYQAMYRHRDSLQIDRELAKKEMSMWAYIMSNAHRNSFRKLCVKTWVWYVSRKNNKMWDN